MARKDFQSGGDGYDINEIVTMASDENGHTVNLRCHVSPSWSALLHQYADDSSWPEYRTIQDILRDALFHRLRWIGEQKNREQYPGVRTLIAEAKLMRWLDTRGEQSTSWARTSQRVDSMLSELYVSESYGTMKEMIDDFDQLATSMEEPYKTRFHKQLRSWADRIGYTWQQSDM